MSLKRKRDVSPLIAPAEVLQQICFGCPSVMSYEASYRSIYSSASRGKADKMVKIFVQTCWRLLLSRDDDRDTLDRLKMVADVCLYLGRYLTSSPWSIATRIARHPCRRAVRKLFHVFTWGGLILKCRRAFDEVRFRPLASGYQVAAYEFDSCTRTPTGD